jgi:hypothetical protein
VGVVTTQVGARGERSSGPGEYDDPHLLARRRPAQLLDQADHHLAGEGVELVGPVQGQPQCPGVQLDLEVAHAVTPSA